jgi:hypothetical protein
MDIFEWTDFYLGRIFEIKKGKRLTKENIIPGDLNFLGAIQGRNGVREKINEDPLFQGNCISVNYNGCGVGEAYYQKEPFWASDDVNVLFLRGHEMNETLAMFFITIIRNEKYRFSYGRKWNKEQMEKTIVKLPAQMINGKYKIDEQKIYSDEGYIPDFSFMEEFILSLDNDVKSIPDYFLDEGYDKACWYMDNINQKEFEDQYAMSILPRKLSLQDREWKYFCLGDTKYFDVQRGSSTYIKNMALGDVPYVSTTQENNGITAYVAESNRKGNLITLAYDGSIGACFYQEEEFFASEKIVTIEIVQYPLNKYIALFLIPILKLESKMYSYGGRKWTVEKQLKETAIKLPVDKNGKDPDYKFMEDYIRSLPFSCNI